MLIYDLSKCGTVPKYIYLYMCIKEDILTGKLKPGEKLPSKRALANHHNLGVVTVANCYEQLLSEGYIVSYERKGYFVEELSELQNRSPGSSQLPLAEPAGEEAAPVSAETGEQPKAEEEDREYSFDFKANRASLDLFPRATWNQLMRKTLYQEDDSLYTTPPYNGLYILRKAIAGYLERERGMYVDPSQIIIGAGTEYLYSRLTQLFGRHSIFGFEDPGYKNLAAITASYGNPCRFIPSDGSGLRVDLLDDSGVDVVHVSPANQFPTGRTMPARRRAELFEWVSRVKKRYIIEDDYDSEFRYKGRYIVPMFADGASEKVIYMNTFSKTMVPSLRISYMVLPKNLVEKYRETVSFYSCTVSSFEQYTLAHFISEGYFERHINRLKNYYRKIRLSLISAVQQSKLADISEIIEHNAGTHFLLEVHTRLTSEEIRTAAEKADINLRMYADYCDFVPQEMNRAIVVNYAGVQEEKIPEMVARLEMMFPECS